MEEMKSCVLRFILNRNEVFDPKKTHLSDLKKKKKPIEIIVFCSCYDPLLYFVFQVYSLRMKLLEQCHTDSSVGLNNNNHVMGGGGGGGVSNGRGEGGGEKPEDEVGS